MNSSSEPLPSKSLPSTAPPTRWCDKYFPLSRASGPRGARTHNPRIKRGRADSPWKFVYGREVAESATLAYPNLVRLPSALPSGDRRSETADR